jgi:hypothetical protein
MTSGTVPAVLLALGALGWLPTVLSQLLAEAYVVVRLAGTGIIVRRLSGAASAPQQGGLWSGLALAGIGVVIAALKQILTH